MKKNGQSKYRDGSKSDKPNYDCDRRGKLWFYPKHLREHKNRRQL